MAVSWIRTVQADLPWGPSSKLIGTVPRGHTLLRIRFSWGFSGVTSTLSSFYRTSNDAQVLGIVTLAGTGTEAVPNPRTSSTDPAPPLSRWLWWEARVPRVQTWDGYSQTATWADAPLGEPTDAKGMVSASVPAGDGLDIWASWAPGYAWSGEGQAVLWFFASVAYQ